MSENRTDLMLGFVGDVLVDRAQPREAFTDVRELLKAPDLLFGNLESPYSDAPEPAVTASLPLVPRLHNLDVYAEFGFGVMSMANNHIVDAGHIAMLDTRARLRAQGVATCGAGENLADARQPAVIEARGLRIGFLAYACVFPSGYHARSTVPGLVPLRAHNHYFEGLPDYQCPGYQPRVQTVPDIKDHEELARDIAAVRRNVDLLVTSFHWGDHLRPFVLTDHETRTARLCIDSGADLVVGHHHHALRGVEWYRGKPIFYGLGHFVFDFRLTITDELRAYFKSVEAPDSYAIFPREGWPLLPMHSDTRLTVLAFAFVQERAVTRIGFVPCRLRPDGTVLPVDPCRTEGREVIEYMERCIRSQNLNARIDWEQAPIVGGCASVCIVPAKP
jgi:poly-gamma-glutamate capsule biosynthesis protein CapA/YwtB (metallophosphatase superfamily)